ncbi:MAG: DNA primase [Nitrosopumilaceae archaeon]|nr:DNA primase [Nitrosopumilaceae archaeon]NIU00277.1 DNA primase [Nitrosopumilaceae archaeon]NIU86689.1 DNA primase [Nitrosopumilaceae archaeon]NIV65384.1 DNA primase [Nitrosopumilaceae archaeon]NIX60879.1 DNA primase [Nitrosopumilaceae archaeon]
MNEKDKIFLEESFKKYYFENFGKIRVPPRTSEREFGYKKFDSGMIRHLSFKDDKALHLLLIKEIPSDVYCSNAYYSFPNLPMNEKDWKEADLIFDIDSKDLHLECRKNHSVIKCKSCNNISQLADSCPNCSDTKLDTQSTTCQECINASRKEVKKLINILTNDLNISEQNIEVFFSGNEGFHVHVYNSGFEKLGSRERSELADYLLLKGIMPETMGFKRFKPEKSNFATLEEKGWRGRIAKEIFGSKSKRPKIINSIISNGYSQFQEQLVSLSNNVRVNIDPNVTTDVHRIFRLPGSLNSKSGLAKIPCINIDSFDPFTDACIISDNQIKIQADCPVQFRLNRKRFGPYKNEIVSVPGYAAVYMICKGLAHLI